MATASNSTAKKKTKTITVKANYPYITVREGLFMNVWGVPFKHVVKTQKGEDFHFLVADLEEDVANEMFELGRVSKFD